MEFERGIEGESRSGRVGKRGGGGGGGQEKNSDTAVSVLSKPHLFS